MEYSWSDLPDDLLHVVYAKLVGHLQRARFAAVCTSWRAAAIVSRHAALPWLIVSYGGKRDWKNHIYCPEDDKYLGIRLPSKAVVNRFVGAHHGGWIAALTRNHVKLVVVNLFSGVEVPLSVKQRKFVPTSDSLGPHAIQKIVFSEAPTSSGCILVALTYDSCVALCRVGSCLEDDQWIMTQEQSRFEDIAFCNGELYGITTGKELFRIDIANKDDGATSVVVVTQLLSIQPGAQQSFRYRNYLLDLDGKVAMARARGVPCISDKPMPLFEVFELDHDHQGETLKWAEMTSLGEHTLFLGKTSSTAVRVPAGGRGLVERNCIYPAHPLFDKAGLLYHSEENERRGLMRIKVAGFLHRHAAMWLIPPSV